MSDLAHTDRLLLDRLLRTAEDDGLTAAAPEDLKFGAPVEWSAGYEDLACGAHLTVVFIRDPDQRATEAKRLRSEAAASGTVVLVGMNGGMLFHGRTPGTSADEDTPGVERLRDLATRFAGRE